MNSILRFIYCNIQFYSCIVSVHIIEFHSQALGLLFQICKKNRLHLDQVNFKLEGFVRMLISAHLATVRYIQVDLEKHFGTGGLKSHIYYLNKVLKITFLVCCKVVEMFIAD